jgi:predicted transcriptional regulator
MSSWYHSGMVKKKEFKARSIKATDEDWKRWQEMARSQDSSLSKLIRDALRREEKRIARKDGKEAE